MSAAMTHIVTVAIVLVGLLVAIVVVAGAVVTILHQGELPFHDYVTDLTILASAIAAAVGAILFRSHQSSKGDQEQ